VTGSEIRIGIGPLPTAIAGAEPEAHAADHSLIRFHHGPTGLAKVDPDRIIDCLR
jgi:hypothetical protein